MLNFLLHTKKQYLSFIFQFYGLPSHCIFPLSLRQFQSRTRRVASTQSSFKRKAVFTSSESEDDVPLASPAKPGKGTAVPKPSVPPANGSMTTVNGNGRKANGRATNISPNDGSELSDSSFGKKASKPKPKRKKPVKKKSKIEQDDVNDPFSEDDTPLATPKKAKHKAVNGTGKLKPKAKSESRGKGSSKKSKEEDEAGKSPKKKKTEEEEEVYRWWDAPADVEGDGSVKWKTLEHNGVLFPPPYQPLPKDVKLLYKGVCFRFTKGATL